MTIFVPVLNEKVQVFASFTFDVRVRYIVKQFAFRRIFYRFAWPTKVPSYRVVTDLSIVISTGFTELNNSCFLFLQDDFLFSTERKEKLKLVFDHKTG